MRLTPEELSARKKRNLALAGALVAFIFSMVVVNTRTVIGSAAPSGAIANISARTSRTIMVAGSV